MGPIFAIMILAGFLVMKNWPAFFGSIGLILFGMVTVAFATMFPPFIAFLILWYIYYKFLCWTKPNKPRGAR